MTRFEGERKRSMMTEFIPKVPKGLLRRFTLGSTPLEMKRHRRLTVASGNLSLTGSTHP
jgi:hypothetical protein